MKKRTLSAVEDAECAALKRIYKSRARELGLTQSKLADTFNISQTAINMYLNGVNPLNIIIAAKFSRVLEVPVREFSARLADDIDNLKRVATSDIDSGHNNVAPMLQPHRKPRKYPLISWVIAGERAESPDNFAPGDAEEWLESTENAGEAGYWLIVKGQSMVSPSDPSFPPGMAILIQPEGFELISGKYYVFKHVSGETTFKQYLYDTGTEYIAPLNPTFKTVEMDDEWVAIGRVVDAKLRGL